jgi:plastocyanin
MRLTIAAAFAALMLLSPAVASGAGAASHATPSARTFTVTLEQMKFGAMPANAHVGDRIVWDNKDVVKHTATARDGSFDVDLPAQSQKTLTLRKAGTVQVYCRYHPTMKAVLKVTS